MKKNVITMILLLLCFNAAIGQLPIVTINTTRPVNSKFSFILRSTVNSSVNVDFGSGTKETFSVSSSNTTIEGTLKGNSVKIYGTASEITYLACIKMSVSSADLSKASELMYLIVSDNQLNTIDVTSNTKLIFLKCDKNSINQLDLTSNKDLQIIDCSENLLSSLIVPDVSNLNLKCNTNKLTFSTLPLEKSGWTYIYTPQRPVAIAKSFYTETEIDLGSLNNANGRTTVYKWISKDGTELSKGTDYTINNGKTVFLKIPADSVCCEMTNTSFPNFSSTNVLKTNYTKIKKPLETTPIISLTTTQGAGNPMLLTFRTDIATNLEVDFGNGTRQELSLEADTYNSITGILAGSTIKVYTTTGSKLIHFICSQGKINSLDVSKATDLKWLDCHSNQLSSLDISKNINLQYLECSSNSISSLDISKNTHLVSILCKNNKLTFASLPPESAFTAYLYAPQYPIPLAKTYNTMDMVDLKSQNKIQGNQSSYKWKTKSGTTLTEGVDYSINSGRTVFLKAQTDSVYCEMTNPSFPDLSGADVLRTTNTRISGESISFVSMKTAKNQGSFVSLLVQSKLDNSLVKIDFGDGSLDSKTIGTNEIELNGTLKETQTIRIYGNSIESLDCSNSQLTELDVSKYKELVQVNCFRNQLNSLDISKNTALEAIDCSENQLSVLNTSANASLKVMYCNNNKLTQLNLLNNRELAALNCSYNQLTDIDLKNNNKLSSFTCNNNYIKTLDVSTNPDLFNITCQNNYLTIATLPIKTIQEYRYAPQLAISIPKSFKQGETLDLSSQSVAGGNNTVYTLKTKGGTTLINGTDYTIDNGKISFLVLQTDSVYCQMTNSSFPYFSGNDALKTTKTKISETATGITVTETEENSVSVYPNPTSDYLYFRNSDMRGENFMIISVSGKLIRKGLMQKQYIDVTELPAGLYLFKIISDNNQDKTIKFLKE